jgi:mediator of RNA polymerase II transcription subunit 7
MMEEQLQRSRKEIQEMDRVKARVQAFLQELEAEGRETAVIDGDGLPKPASIESRPQDKQDRNAGRAQEMWELLDDIDPT